MWVWQALAGLAAGHLIASFMQTVLHRLFGHGPFGGWVRARHVDEHHSIYSGERLALPRYSEAEKSLTLVYLLPGCGAILLCFLWLPPVFAAGFGAGAFLSYFLHIFLHAQFHLSQPLLEGQIWFRRLRDLHMVHHHRQNKNFAVIDLYWDKLMGTFSGVEGADA